MLAVESEAPRTTCMSRKSRKQKTLNEVHVTQWREKRSTSDEVRGADEQTRWKRSASSTPLVPKKPLIEMSSVNM